MTKQNITYLIGAGASCQALPLVKDFRKESYFAQVIFQSVPTGPVKPDDLNPIDAVIKLLGVNQNLFEKLIKSDDFEEDLEKLKVDFANDLKWMKEACLEHATIDTFAKKLYLTRNRPENLQNYQRLKNTLSAYFMWEQFLKPPDKRYDTFFASIAHNKDGGEIKLPSNIKVISWNYDFQFEKSYSKYYKSQDISEVQSYEALNCFPNLKIAYTDNRPYKSDKFSIVKLNGTAGLHRSGDKTIEDLVEEQMWYTNDSKGLREASRKILKFIELYKAQESKAQSLLSFAWERESNMGLHKHYNTVSEANKIAIETDILVIIGYSFPFFNREIDREIFESLINRPGSMLQKIYYQAPAQDVDFLEQRLTSIIGKESNYLIEMRTDIEDFFIPPQFSF